MFRSLEYEGPYSSSFVLIQYIYFCLTLVFQIPDLCNVF